MEDTRIIALFENRNERALIETSKKYGAYLFTICMNVLGKKEDSEECVNDTYHIVWNKIPPEKPKRFLPYIGRIAKNTALNRYDYLTADKRNTHFDTTLSELLDIGSDDVFDCFSEQELAKSISVFLRSSDERARNIFVRRYWYNDKIEDIAKMFGISAGNTKVILLRMRQKLQSHLKKEGYIV